MLFGLWDLSWMACYSPDGAGGGAAGAESQDDKDKDKNKDTGKDGDGKDTITMTKADYEKKLQEKFAEGARKAAGGKEIGSGAPAGGDGNPGSSIENDVKAMKEELALYKGMKIAADNGVMAAHQEDLIAIVKGKGQDVNEENIKKVIEKHPEWLVKNNETSGVQPFGLGSTSGKSTPPQLSEQEQAAKLFGL